MKTKTFGTATFNSHIHPWLHGRRIEVRRHPIWNDMYQVTFDNHQTVFAKKEEVIFDNGVGIND